MNRFTKSSDDAASLIISAIFLGLVTLAAGWGAARAVEFHSMQGLPQWMGIFINYAIMLGVALIFVLASSMGDPSTFGFTRPRVAGGYGSAITWGLTLGVIASIVNLTAGAGRIGPVQGLSFLQIVLLVWLLASVAEEVLVRGYVQSYMTPLVDRGFTVFRLRFSVPVIISALFFAAMHLILLASGTSFLTTYIVVVFAFVLGLVAAYQRERTGSVLPPIAAHISFNVGGMIGGIIFVIIQIALFGKSAVEVTKAIGG
jgi:membrane protease YdiL (CAAX protease family)